MPPQSAPPNSDPDALGGPQGPQIPVTRIDNGEAFTVGITPFLVTLPGPPPVVVKYSNLFVCSGTAELNFFNDGSGNLEHAFVSFDLPDPIVTPSEPLEEFGPHLVFNHPGFPIRPDATFAVLDRFVASASPASFFVLGGSAFPMTVAVDWADADYDGATGRVALTAQLALHGGISSGAVGLSRVSYEVSFLAGTILPARLAAVGDASDRMSQRAR